MKTGGRETQRRFFSQVRFFPSMSAKNIFYNIFIFLMFDNFSASKTSQTQLYPIQGSNVTFEVTAEEMELLYEKFKEDFLLFGYSLDFYKS